MTPVVIGEEYFPSLEVQSDEEILDFIHENIMTFFHLQSTVYILAEKLAEEIILQED
ncbi:uncharacterized protein ACLA_003660 [Aspergillus clavatus NRRL 1]|uniref:Uncharacterized protein n=1 Tax=Aspergillus clavatus (strain ATCC 1007 / CBS 513.65 / DSM 816 / NCTC 3887 / NRRL 1 / QM 1276 / 107) TaxID=344612 RepID=A1C5I5_ASPCL|nr:uncharacterized protein ACLA_003660 [Aspergillus clavatus NRRL 1]EAW14953.1 hypothetical protein ACLA_003660 [Aspergillus clavatus NRRL 1]